MADRLKAIQAKLLEWWNQFTSKQKTIIVIMGAVVIFTFAILLYIFSRPQYVTFRQLASATETSAIVEVLDSAGIPNQVTGGGLTIEVEASQVDMAEVALGAAGLATSDPSLKDAISGGMSTTESERQKYYVEYLEKYLESNFENYTAVKSAKVQLHIPDQDGTLIAKQEESSAYIQLELNGTFTQENAANMAKATAAKLGNKSTENIIIMDTHANLLFSGEGDYTTAGQASSYLELTEQAEAFIKHKVANALLSSGQFHMVEVSPFLEFDYSSYEYTEHRYEAQDGREEGYKSHETVTESENTNGGGGVPGTDSNDDDKTTYVYEDGGDSSSSTSHRETDYLLDETMLSKMTPAGVIAYDKSSITVTAIAYNAVREEVVKSQGLLDDMTWEQYKDANNISVKIDVDDDFYSAVATATGIDKDEITIVAFRQNLFYDQERADVNWTDILSVATIIIILVLLGIVVYQSMGMKMVSESEEELSVEDLLQSTPEPEINDIGIEPKSETRRMIEKFVDENPEIAANLLRNWLDEDWR